MMLKWDYDLIHDNLTTADGNGRLKRFSPHGQTLHDYERRFQAEDEGLISEKEPAFKWDWLDAELNYRIPEVFEKGG